MGIWATIAGLFKQRHRITQQLEDETQSLKRIQEIIELTDAVHSSLEKNIRKRLLQNEPDASKALPKEKYTWEDLKRLRSLGKL